MSEKKREEAFPLGKPPLSFNYKYTSKQEKPKDSENI